MKITCVPRVLTLGMFLGLLVVHPAFPFGPGTPIETEDSIEASSLTLPRLLLTDTALEPIAVVNQSLEIDLGRSVNVESSRNISIEDGRISAKDASKEAYAASSSIEAPISFSSLGVKWTASSGDGDLGIAIRTSADGINWSPWFDVGVDEHLTNRNSKIFFSNLISVPEGVSHIQYAVRLTGTQGISASPELTSLALAFIDPGKTSSDILEQLETTDQPVMLSRTEWGCPDGEESLDLNEVTTVVTHLIVHHTVTSNSSADWPASVRAIWSYHAIDRGWGDIGYNFLIDPLGTIYIGRAGGDNIRGAHFSCQNTGTQGIALLGDFTSVAPTVAATDSLEALLAWLAVREGIDPVAVSFHNGTQLDLSNIAGHRDGNPSTTTCSTTACPGDTFYPMLPEIRRNVEALTVGEFLMNVGLNDAWYNPVTDGQGFFITVFPDLGLALIAWFTYDTELPLEDSIASLGDAGHRWLLAVGPYEKNEAVLDIEIASGGLFDIPSEITRVWDGTIKLSFEDCNTGTVEYNIPSIGYEGIVPIQRVAKDNIVLCEILNDELNKSQ